jgi:hypothetical protein
MATILQHTSLYTRSIEYGAVVLSGLDNHQLHQAEFDGLVGRTSSLGSNRNIHHEPRRVSEQ